VRVGVACTAVKSGDVRGMARSEAPCRLFAFMLLFFVSSGAGSSSRMLVSPALRVLRRMMCDWRLMYEDTVTK
jgi:hypothetical protein